MQEIIGDLWDLHAKGEMLHIYKCNNKSILNIIYLNFKGLMFNLYEGNICQKCDYGISKCKITMENCHVKSTDYGAIDKCLSCECKYICIFIDGSKLHD